MHIAHNWIARAAGVHEIGFAGRRPGASLLAAVVVTLSVAEPVPVMDGLSKLQELSDGRPEQTAAERLTVPL